MNQYPNATFGDKEQMTDLLSSEKFLAGTYNACLLEAATPEVKQCMSQLLNDTHTAQQTLFEEMNSRGWYPVTKAQDVKLDSEKQKFAGKVTV